MLRMIERNIRCRSAIGVNPGVIRLSPHQPRHRIDALDRGDRFGIVTTNAQGGASRLLLFLALQMALHASVVGGVLQGQDPSFVFGAVAIGTSAFFTFFRKEFSLRLVPYVMTGLALTIFRFFMAVMQALIESQMGLFLRRSGRVGVTATASDRAGFLFFRSTILMTVQTAIVKGIHCFFGGSSGSGPCVFHHARAILCVTAHARLGAESIRVLGVIEVNRWPIQRPPLRRKSKNDGGRAKDRFVLVRTAKDREASDHNHYHPIRSQSPGDAHDSLSPHDSRSMALTNSSLMNLTCIPSL